MIVKNLAEIFESIIAYEKIKLCSFEFKTSHAPTIGEQYEKIVMKGLKSLFPQYSKIRVVTGFIYNNDNKVSRQIDCMIVKGKGRQDPAIKNKFYYHIHNVLAVIEVKKNLFKADIADSYTNLYSFISPEFDTTYPKLSAAEITSFFHSFAVNSGRLINSHNEVDDSSDILYKQVFYGFRNDYTRPLRIVFGYDGLASEMSLRNKFNEFLAEHLGQEGFGPFSHPDLIVCGNHCLFKLNAEPYPAYLTKNEYFFYASSSNYNITILVELILGRLSRYYPINYIFDNQVEPFNMFLSASITEQNGKYGWQIDTIAVSSEVKNVSAKWEPHVVSSDQFALFNFLCRGDLDINGTIVQEYVQADGDILTKMLNTKLVAIKGTHLVLLTTRLQGAITPDGNLIVGEDAFGNFSEWLTQYLEQRSQQGRKD